MKKLLLFTGLILYLFSCTSCSQNEDSEFYSQKDFKSTHYIKQEMVGKWEYWGRFFVDRNKWVATDGSNIYYYDFRED